MNDRYYHVMLIPSEGDAKEPRLAFRDPEQAAGAAERFARVEFPGQKVEIVVIETKTREAVINRFVEPSKE